MKPYLADSEKTRELLERHGFFIKKGYGQNFLIDSSVPEDIVEAAGLGPMDAVLEIGPGIGSLTQYLAAAAGRVLAVEIDRKLEPVLAESLAGYDNISLIWGDFLKLDPEALLEAYGVTPPVKVVANLPYYITTPILMRLLKRQDLFSSITVMVQEEVGERMAALPGGKDYGYLSLSVQYYADPRLILRVPPHAFIPQPKVSSAVVQLTARKEALPGIGDPEFFFEVAKGAFLQRRKTLANALAGYGPLGLNRQQVEEALKDMGLDPIIRGEKMSMEDFAALTERVQHNRGNQEESSR